MTVITMSRNELRRLRVLIDIADGRLSSAKLETPASRSSLTNPSCNVLWARSTRPLAWLELARRCSELGGGMGGMDY
jgi:hypothetical protein